MSKFTDNVTQNTPRLVVLYQNQDGNEAFKWGAVGMIPALNLVGAIARVQMELFTCAGEECPEPALVITWDATNKTFDWYIHSSIPVEPMVGMLEMVKNIVMTAHTQQQGPMRNSILGPDGRPIPR